MKEKILILQRIIPHYRTGFFNKFMEKFPASRIIYGQPHENESLRNAENLNQDYFIRTNNFYLGKNESTFISKMYSFLFSFHPGIVISVFNLGNLNIYFLFLLKNIIGFKLILWSFGYDPFSGFNPEKRFTDKVRLQLFQKADAVIFYWEQGKDIVGKFSKKTDHYFVAPNTLDTERQNQLREIFDKTGIDKIKNELQVKEKYHFVYVGRLLDIKQIDLLLAAYSIVEKEGYDCRLTIIGDGPEAVNLKNLSAQLSLKKINFTGEIHDEEITGKWIYISDVFVMPGRLGLSVVHSFSFGTPVISQKKNSNFHSEGVGYIADGFNGFLTEDGNINEIAGKMKLIISDRKLSGELRKNALDTAKNNCSIEKMIDGFGKAISYVKEK